ncbi:glycosyltransferase family 39 protein [Streptomyces sp. I05A-00742]|uniref:glycosyltransferase family 39 protein n=1 Tax=Streptomyces sp. I05A-00742 TaxID=2732853 RepID=UPI001489574B|nr:glycosyltransferase family 39 protein [Streptomyces sp. I05A-00742]
MGRTPLRAVLTGRGAGTLDGTTAGRATGDGADGEGARGADGRTDRGGRSGAAARAAVLLSAGLMLVIGLWGLDRGTVWRDEGATLQVARRSLPEIVHMLGTVDAVHGLYYVLMHAVVAVHDDEVTLRLPSVVAAAVTAGLVAALGCRLARPRVGLWAGLLYAATPFVSHHAQEARSYALVAAGAALATWLLVRAVERGSAARWAGYGATVAVTALLHEFAILLLAAHGLTLLAARVPWRTWRGWAGAALAACAALAPLVVLSRGQSEQVSWIRTPGYAEAKGLVLTFAGSGDLVAGVTLTLAAFALAAPLPRTGPPEVRRLPLNAVALPLALVPPVLLYAASQSRPLFLDRYLLFSLAGVPLLAAAGLERVLRFLPGRRAVAAAGALAVAAGFLWQLPQQQRERLPAGRGDEPARVAAALGRQARPGDAVLFLPLHERRIALFYPRPFTGLRDLTLKRSPAASGTLYGVEAGEAELRRRLAGLPDGGRVWVVGDTTVGSRWLRGQRAEYAKIRVLRELCREESAVFVRGGAVSRYSCRPPGRAAGGRAAERPSAGGPAVVGGTSTAAVPRGKDPRHPSAASSPLLSVTPSPTSPPPPSRR